MSIRSLSPHLLLILNMLLLEQNGPSRLDLLHVIQLNLEERRPEVHGLGMETERQLN